MSFLSDLPGIDPAANGEILLSDDRSDFTAKIPPEIAEAPKYDGVMVKYKGRFIVSASGLWNLGAFTSANLTDALNQIDKTNEP